MKTHRRALMLGVFLALFWQSNSALSESDLVSSVLPVDDISSIISLSKLACQEASPNAAEAAVLATLGGSKEVPRDGVLQLSAGVFTPHVLPFTLNSGAQLVGSGPNTLLTCCVHSSVNVTATSDGAVIVSAGASRVSITNLTVVGCFDASPIFVSSRATVDVSHVQVTGGIPDELHVIFDMTLIDAMTTVSLFFHAGRVFVTDRFDVAGVAYVGTGAAATMSHMDVSLSFGSPAGAFFVHRQASLTLSDTNVTFSFGAFGGVIYQNGLSHVSLTRATMLLCTARLLDGNVTTSLGELTAGIAVVSETASLVVDVSSIVLSSGLAAGCFNVFGSLIMSDSHILQCKALDSVGSSLSSLLGAGAITVVSNGRIDVSHTTFESCASHIDGGAIALYDFAEAHLTDCTFRLNTARFSGGSIALDNSARATLARCTFDECLAYHGGAISVSKFALLTANILTLNANFASYGGALATFDESLAKLTNVTIRASVALQGGAIGMSDSSGILATHLSASHCITQGWGGVFLLLHTSHIECLQCSFEHNIGVQGGVVQATMDGRFECDECALTNNTAVFGGGCVSLTGSARAVLAQSYIVNNTASQESGGVASVLENGNITLIGSTFIGNVAQSGGVIYMSDLTFVNVNNCTFIDNHARTSTGGVIHATLVIAEGSSVTPSITSMYELDSVTSSLLLTRLDRVTIAAGLQEDNTNLYSPNFDGLVAAANATLSQLSVERSIFKDNSAQMGGAIFAEDTSVRITTSIFDRNLAVGNSDSVGGAVFVGVPTVVNSEVVVQDCHFHHNEAALGAGGAMALDARNNASYLIDQVVVTGNRARLGGAVFLTNVNGSDPTINPERIIAELRSGIVASGNVASEYGEIVASNPYQLLVVSPLATLDSRIEIFSGDLVTVTPIVVRMVDIFGQITLNLNDRLNGLIGTCEGSLDMPLPSLLSNASFINNVDLLMLSLVNGTSTIDPAPTVYGLAGNYCISFKSDNDPNILGAVIPLTILDCNLIGPRAELIPDGNNDAYPRCTQRVEVMDSLRIALVVIGWLVFLVALLFYTYFVRWRSIKVVQVFGLPLLSCLILSCLFALVITMLHSSNWSPSDCSVLLVMASFEIVAVIAPLLVKFFSLRLAAKVQVRNVSMVVPGWRVVAATVFMLSVVSIVIGAFAATENGILIEAIIRSDDLVYTRCALSSALSILLLVILGLPFAWLLYQTWRRRNVTTLYSESSRLSYLLWGLVLLSVAAAVIVSIESGRQEWVLFSAAILSIATILLIIVFVFMPVALVCHRSLGWHGGDKEAFVSYAASDRKFMSQLVLELSEYGVGVHVDEVRAEAGAFWRKEVAQAIRASKVLLFIVSKESVVSPYCLEEVQYAYDCKLQIFPIIRDSEAMGMADAGLEMLLKRYQWTNMPATNSTIDCEALIAGLARFLTGNTPGTEMALLATGGSSKGTSIGISSSTSGVAAGGVPAKIAVGRDLGPGLADAVKPQEVFISWAHRDHEIVKARLWPDLEKAGFDCWIDFLGLSSGDYWRTTIGDAVRGCRVLLFVATPTSVSSQYCQEEVMYAQELKKTIVVLIAADCTTELLEHALVHDVLESAPAVDAREHVSFVSAFGQLQRVLRHYTSPTGHQLNANQPCHKGSAVSLADPLTTVAATFGTLMRRHTPVSSSLLRHARVVAQHSSPRSHRPSRVSTRLLRRPRSHQEKDEEGGGGAETTEERGEFIGTEETPPGVVTTVVTKPSCASTTLLLDDAHQETIELQPCHMSLV